ncbi:MAG TPA: hypothetical protein V6C97_27440, partial [Oculatellaceae cyanobacterium]
SAMEMSHSTAAMTHMSNTPCLIDKIIRSSKTRSYLPLHAQMEGKLETVPHEQELMEIDENGMDQNAVAEGVTFVANDLDFWVDKTPRLQREAFALIEEENRRRRRPTRPQSDRQDPNVIPVLQCL